MQFNLPQKLGRSLSTGAHRIRVCAVFIATLAGAQGLAADNAAVAGTVRIRVTNVSAVPYSAITIRFPSQTEDYGALAPGATSDYRDIGLAFRYASATIVAEGQRHRALAADYFNEKRLEPGSYTYTLDIASGAPRFGLIVDSE